MDIVGTKMKINKMKCLRVCNIYYFFFFHSCLWPITLPDKYPSKHGNILREALKYGAKEIKQIMLLELN